MMAARGSANFTPQCKLATIFARRISLAIITSITVCSWRELVLSGCRHELPQSVLCNGGPDPSLLWAGRDLLAFTRSRRTSAVVNFLKLQHGPVAELTPAELFHSAECLPAVAKVSC